MSNADKIIYVLALVALTISVGVVVLQPWTWRR